MSKMTKSYIHEGNIVSIEVELKYTKVEKEGLSKPQFLHRIRGFVNDQLVQAIDTNNRNLEEQIDKMDEVCRKAKVRIKKKLDAVVKRLIELGFR